MNCARQVSIAWVIVCLLLLGGPKMGFAQADDELWSQSVNLSQSGAAESPLLVVGPEQQIQAFWWDRFDGLTTAHALAGGWSDPAPAPIQIDVDAADLLPATAITAMPQIVGVGETAFAVWLGAPDRETGLRPLLYSRLSLGTTVWTTPETLARSAVAWKMTSDAQGVLHLVYCQTSQSDVFPAGIYYIRSTDSGITWSERTALYTSLYARLWTADTAHLSLVTDTSGNVVLGWDDPRQESAFYTLSTDAGLSWSEPAAVGDGDVVGLHPRFVALPVGARGGEKTLLAMFWEPAGVAFTCVWQQQQSEDGGRTWSAASRVFEDLTSCPVQIATAQTPTGLLLLMRGEDTGSLSVTAWNGAQWSALKRLSFSFEDFQTGETIYLKALQANVTPDGALVVVGQGQDNDIWVLEGQVDTVEWVFAPPSLWSSPTVVSEGMLNPGLPAAAIDTEGNVHLMWTAVPSAGQSGSALYHSRWDKTSWSRPVAVLGSDEGVAQALTLVFAEPFLHAVWSGGPAGAVFYSRSYSDDAYTTSGWSTPLMLDEIAVGGSPVLTVDLLGRLHVVYAVPFNEGRGIYYTRSDDDGESWQEVVRVFDAVTEDWTSVNHPAVTVDERGTIHVVWVRASLPDQEVSQSVYYAQSMDHGETWTDAILLADGAYDWPQVGANFAGQVVVMLQDLTRNIAEYRSSSDYGLTWGYLSQVPGLQALVGRAVLLQDRSGRLHIAALDTQASSGVTLHHLIYAEGQWSGPDSVALTGVDAPVDGMVLAVAGELGVVDGVGLGSRRGDDGLTPVIWHTRRTIESQAPFEPDFAPAPTPTPIPGPTPTPTPTPRPVVDPYPSQPSAPVLALGPISMPVLALGGIGIALLLVSVIVIIKAVKR
mgnify:FL=1